MNGKRLTALTFALAVIGALFVAFGPMGHVTEGSGTPGGEIVERSYNVSLFHTDGWWILVVVSVPVLLALIPVVIPRRNVRVVSATLLWIGCLVGFMSVGMFFIPAAIAMTIGATRPQAAPDPRRRRDPVTAGT